MVLGVPETEEEEEGITFLRNVVNVTVSVDSSLQQRSTRNVRPKYIYVNYFLMHPVQPIVNSPVRTPILKFLDMSWEQVRWKSVWKLHLQIPSVTFKLFSPLLHSLQSGGYWFTWWCVLHFLFHHTAHFSQLLWHTSNFNFPNSPPPPNRRYASNRTLIPCAMELKFTISLQWQAYTPCATVRLVIRWRVMTRQPALTSGLSPSVFCLSKFATGQHF